MPTTAPNLGGLLGALKVCAVGLLIVTASACRTKPKNFDNENDDLRRQLDASQTQIEVLQARNRELEAQVAEAARRLEAATGEPAADVVASIPRCAGVKIGRLSSVDPSAPDRLTLYITPYDGRQRFVQVAGSLSASATLLSPDVASDQGPVVAGVVTLGPKDLREAYRSSPLGTHYTVEIELDPPAVAEAGVLVRVRLDDAVTGLSHQATRVVVAP
jgi:hypothetical protein